MRSRLLTTLNVRDRRRCNGSIQANQNRLQGRRKTLSGVRGVTEAVVVVVPSGEMDVACVRRSSKRDLADTARRPLLRVGREPATDDTSRCWRELFSEDKTPLPALIFPFSDEPEPVLLPRLHRNTYQPSLPSTS